MGETQLALPWKWICQESRQKWEMSEKLKEADRLRLRVQKIPDYLSLSESIREWLCVGVAREEAGGGAL